ncbi:VMA21-like domain protein [Ancylostoma ceylanicum]|uniref:VMA21-like domain protein n=1 Tax=Ancylostoma ceylanicum TaxID=53326 RepID=A0A0D6LCI2_9BILA|nr:VMA21-like domain protein [Ancylostoma ceylanicum]
MLGMMSDECGVVRGGSSSSISTADSFENVTGPTSSESSGSRESPVVDEDGKPVESREQPISSDVIDTDTVEEVCSNEPFYTNVSSRRAISNLIKFSAAMFVLPLLTMFTTYHYIFRDYFHLPPDQAMLYAGANRLMDELIPNLRDERVQGAVKSLLVYSIVILLVPLGSMFFLKRYLFEEFFGYTPNDSLTYSAIIAVILVHPNDPSNMTVFRCCLPRLNPYYSFDGPMDPDLDGDVPDPRLPEDAPELCEVCGCHASKKCGKCGTAWYCCRDHQALDWTTRHKQCCGNVPDPVAPPPLTNPLNKFLFKEYGIEMDQTALVWQHGLPRVMYLAFRQEQRQKPNQCVLSGRAAVQFFTNAMASRTSD